MIWTIWWAWGIAAFVFAFAELLLPSYVFLGFATGAAITGALLYSGGGLAAWVGGSITSVILTFAILSLVSWIVVRRLLGLRQGQVKIIDRDINEN